MKKVLWTILVIVLLVLWFGVFDFFFNGKWATQNLCDVVIDTRETVTAEVDNRIGDLEKEVERMNENLEDFFLKYEELMQSMEEIQDVEITGNEELDREIKEEVIEQRLQDTINETDEQVISKEELEQMQELLEKLQSVE